MERLLLRHHPSHKDYIFAILLRHPPSHEASEDKSCDGQDGGQWLWRTKEDTEGFLVLSCGITYYFALRAAKYKSRSVLIEDCSLLRCLSTGGGIKLDLGGKT